MKIIITLSLLAFSLVAQTPTGSQTAAPSAVMDWSTAGTTRPFTVQATAPATCTANLDWYYNSTSQILYKCTATNTWTAQASGGGGGLIGTASLTFPSIPDGTSADQTFTLTGTATGSAVSPILPVLASGLTPTVFVSAANTIDVRIFNSSGGPLTPAVATYGALIQVGTFQGSGSITFTSINDGGCGTGTFTLTGAQTGNAISPEIPSAFPASWVPAMFVSAANTVTVSACNYTGATATISALTYGAIVN